MSTAVVLLMGILLFSACAPKDAVQTDGTKAFEDALLTATYAIRIPTGTATQTLTIQPTETTQPTLTFTPSPTAYIGTPPSIPESFTTQLLRGSSLPQSYIADTCEVLKNRLDPNKSAPGTVVMLVMFHGITKDFREIPNPMDVHHADMVEFLEHAHELGFQTITTRQLVGFLETNEKIPARSLLIILDDRRPGAVREHFMEYLVKYNWTLTLGWLIGDTDIRPASPLECCPDEPYTTLWEQMEAYNATGYLDVQSHGFVHNIPIDESSTDEYILGELGDSRRTIQEHFYCKDPQSGALIENCQTDQPLGFIWPGGGFSARAAELARETGYRVAFTTNPRGPVMYNWIPLAEAYDASTPGWLPETEVGDPLMVLPRYWSYDAAYRMDDVANIGEQARAFADTNRQQELDYYYYYCKETAGEIPLLVNAQETSE